MYSPVSSPLFVALAIAWGAAPALAQTTPVLAAAGVEQSFQLDVQPLAQALNLWARQTGMQLLVQQQYVIGKTAPPLQGRWTAQAALAAGATGFTHLYNAMSPLTSREPGVVGAALADPHSWCGVILDGLHVHPLAVKVALAAKPRGKLLIVTDAMSPVGTNQTEFDFFDGKVIRDGNKLTNLNGNLAGSVLDMAGAVSYAVKELGLELSEAVRMASLYPAEFLGISAERGQIKVGAKADLVLLNDNGLVQQCWLAGDPFMEQ